MKTQKKAQAKPAPIITQFRELHEPKIKGSAEAQCAVWIEAGIEAIALFPKSAKIGNEYAKASLSNQIGNGETLHSENTIRQYVGACVTVIRKYAKDTPITLRMTDKAKKQIIGDVFDAVIREYSYASIGSLRAVARGNGQRGKTSKPKQFNAKREATKYTKAQLQAMLAAK